MTGGEGGAASRNRGKLSVSLLGVVGRPDACSPASLLLLPLVGLPA